jgi:hypothetical protein
MPNNPIQKAIATEWNSGICMESCFCHVFGSLPQSMNNDTYITNLCPVINEQKFLVVTGVNILKREILKYFALT